MVTASTASEELVGGWAAAPEGARLNPPRDQAPNAKFDLDFSKVRVRYNPEGDPALNERQLGRLKRLADWLHDNDRRFLFELLVPAEPAQLEKVGGDSDRYDAELRPELMRRVI